MRLSIFVTICALSLVSANLLESIYYDSQPRSLFSRNSKAAELEAVYGIQEETSKLSSGMEEEAGMEEVSSMSSSGMASEMEKGTMMKEETSKSSSGMASEMEKGTMMKEETSKSSSGMASEMEKGTMMKEETSKSSSGMASEMEMGMKEGSKKSATDTEKMKMPSNVKEAEAPSIETQVIVVWINEGGKKETKTVNSMAMPPAATHNVVVGGAAGLQFVPEEVKANVGDMVVFQFMSNNHSATQSAFKEPCKALPDGIDSGFMPNMNNTIVPAPRFAMQVKVTTPIWFYCKQKGHCGKGMTFSINPGPTGSGKTQLDFKEMAIKTGNEPVPPILGGAPPKGVPPPMAPPMAPPKAPPMAAPPMAPPSSPPPPTIVPGTGNNNSGTCSCSCVCGMAAFPNLATQGIGSYGGMPGALPMAAMGTMGP
ncbi:hypothetical protein K3495_g5891 [Podosphaera aphanis]|nr:hypothetical protein K3495_g5891 [Podosphaera aphanis]